MEPEYNKRIQLCFDAVRKATSHLQLGYQGAKDYQGIEVPIETENGQAKVIILLDTGHRPRFPKYITISVHGYFENKFNGKVSVAGSRYGSSKEKFLPNKISTKWIIDAILKSSEALQSICSTDNMERVKKLALAKRRQDVKNTPYMRHQTSYFNVNELK